MEIKKPTIKSIPYEEFKNNEYLEEMVKQLNETVPTFGWDAWMTLSTGDEATLFGRLPLRPAVAVSSSWQWVLPGMISPASGLK